MLVANSSYNSDLFDLKLESGHLQLIVGRGFIGCILQGAGVVLNDSNIYSYEVAWGKCPYLLNPLAKDTRLILVFINLVTKIVDALCDKPEYNQCQNGGTCQEDVLGNFTTCACPP
ncbi:protein crumbs [Caerostris extrusa]|uniref:Protein crumbs n=1 Tax=Caerostris extrusa TaxID=172846 RepID=A0AAV4XMH2_CAEEX|nr:protein crumbs [Caerostris extrusa]